MHELKSQHRLLKDFLFTSMSLEEIQDALQGAVDDAEEERTALRLAQPEALLTQAQALLIAEYKRAYYRGAHELTRQFGRQNRLAAELPRLEELQTEARQLTTQLHVQQAQFEQLQAQLERGENIIKTQQTQMGHLKKNLGKEQRKRMASQQRERLLKRQLLDALAGIHPQQIREREEAERRGTPVPPDEDSP